MCCDLLLKHTEKFKSKEHREYLRASLDPEGKGWGEGKKELETWALLKRVLS